MPLQTESRLMALARSRRNKSLANIVDSDPAERQGPTKAAKKTLFDLPVEIRLQIYSYFVDLPPRPSFRPPYSRSYDAHAIAARKALLLVCRKVYEEWKPLSKGEHYIERNSLPFRGSLIVEIYVGALGRHYHNNILNFYRLQLLQKLTFSKLSNSGAEAYEIEPFLKWLTKWKPELHSVQEIKINVWIRNHMEQYEMPPFHYLNPTSHMKYSRVLRRLQLTADSLHGQGNKIEPVYYRTFLGWTVTGKFRVSNEGMSRYHPSRQRFDLRGWSLKICKPDDLVTSGETMFHPTIWDVDLI